MADRGRWPRPVSVLGGGASYPRVVRGLAVESKGRMAGRERLRRRSCALVVVGSLRRDAWDDFWPVSLRRGVDGGNDWTDDGVVGVGTLDTDDWAEWPSRD